MFCVCCARSDLYLYLALAVAVDHPRFSFSSCGRDEHNIPWKLGLGQGTFGVCYLQVKLNSLF